MDWLFQSKWFFPSLSLVVGLLLVVNIVTTVIPWFDDEFTPLHGSGYDFPQQADDVITAGGILSVGPVEKCNSNHKSVIVNGTLTWRKLYPVTKIVEGIHTDSIRPPGCVTFNYENMVPEELTPGTWVLTGTDEAFLSGNTQKIGWETEPFEVQ